MNLETKDNYIYTIYYISGKEILNGINEVRKSIRVNELDNGVYIIRVESAGIASTGKFIKQ